MTNPTYFDALKARLLNKRWIAIPLLLVIVVAGAVKIWKDFETLFPPKPPSGSPAAPPKVPGGTLKSEVCNVPFPDRPLDCPL